MFRKTLGIALKVFVSGTLIWYLLSDIDIESAQARLQEADPALLVASILLLSLQIFIGGFRWRAVNQAIDAVMSIK